MANQKLTELTDRLVGDCLGYTRGHLVLLADQSNMDIAYSIMESAARAKEDAMRQTHLINIDHWRKGKPLTTLAPDMRAEIEQGLGSPEPENNVLLYIQQSLDGEDPMRKQLMELGQSKGKVGGLRGCTVDVLSAGLRQENGSFSDELYELLSNERKY